MDTLETRREFLYRTFRDAICERFLRGEDFEFINYAEIDQQESAANILAVARDEEERYFDGLEENSIAAAALAPGALSDTILIDVAEEDYMNFDLSQL